GRPPRGVVDGDADAAFVVAVAASTGGPRALMELLPRLPAGLSGVVVLVQHMPQHFTGSFAERLDGVSAMPVAEAVPGQELRAGRVVVAPGGIHLAVRREGGSLVFDTLDSAKVWGVRPSADVFMASAAAHFGPRSIAVVLTGMGRDGADGARRIREVGGRVITQDEVTSTVYGMPRASAPIAHDVLPLERIADGIVAAAASIESPDHA
ncbi:MAG: CheB methylesterase domain-containing protein, partial [Longimicrobiales bacterium]